MFTAFFYLVLGIISFVRAVILNGIYLKPQSPPSLPPRFAIHWEYVSNRCPPNEADRRFPDHGAFMSCMIA